MDEKERERIKKEVQEKSKKYEMEYEKNKREFEKSVNDASEELESLDKAIVAEGIRKAQGTKEQRELQLKRRMKYLMVGITISVLGVSNIANSIVSYKKGVQQGLEDGKEVTDVNLDEIPNNYTIDNAPDELLIKWANYAFGKYQETETNNDNIQAVKSEFDETMGLYTDYEELKEQFYNKTQSDNIHKKFINGICELNDVVSDEFKFQRLYSKAIIEDGVIKLPVQNIGYDFNENSYYGKNGSDTVVYVPENEYNNEGGYKLH